MSTPDTSIRLTFPARAEYLILARLALAGFARATPLDDEVLADLKLAVTEACGNVVRHAYPDGEGPVEVTIRETAGVVEIRVQDEGVGLDDGAGTLGTDPTGESGMGLSIISAVADELSVEPAGPGGGTVVLLRKSTAA